MQNPILFEHKTIYIYIWDPGDTYFILLHLVCNILIPVSPGMSSTNPPLLTGSRGWWKWSNHHQKTRFSKRSSLKMLQKNISLSHIMFFLGGGIERSIRKSDLVLYNITIAIAGNMESLWFEFPRQICPRYLKQSEWTFGCFQKYGYPKMDGL